MSLDGAYDRDNVFARIIRGEIPAYKIYEDDDVLAFMDAFPQARGHALVISKTSQARNILEIEPEALAKVAAATQRVAKALREVLKPDGIVVMQFNGAPAGQTVYHLHFHVIPRVEGVAMKGHGQAGMADKDDTTALAAQLAERLRG